MLKRQTPALRLWDTRGTEIVVNIPAEIDDQRVTEISENAFANSGVEKVTLPDTVTSIGSQAFAGCEKLTEILIPSSVAEIASASVRQDRTNFSFCSSLTLYMMAINPKETAPAPPLFQLLSALVAPSPPPQTLSAHLVPASPSSRSIAPRRSQRPDVRAAAVSAAAFAARACIAAPPGIPFVSFVLFIIIHLTLFVRIQADSGKLHVEP